MLIVIVGVGFTVIEVVTVPSGHPALVEPVTVYVVVVKGEAITLEPVVVFKSVAGDHK